MRWALGVLAAAVLAACSTVVSAAPPDLSGVWELDIARSTVGKTFGTAPLARRDTLIQRGVELEVHSHIEGKNDLQQHLAYRYRLDGRETVNTMSGVDVKSVARWKGEELEIKSRAQMLVITLEVDERWRIENDGRRLRIERVSRSPIGTQPQTLVFVKR